MDKAVLVKIIIKIDYHNYYYYSAGNYHDNANFHYDCYDYADDHNDHNHNYDTQPLFAL